MSVFRKIESIVSGALTLIGSLCFSAIVAIVIANVILRFVFNAPIMWSIEGCSILVVWMTFIVFGVNHKLGLHFRIDALVHLLGEPAKRAVNFAVDILTLACVGILLFSTVEAVIANGGMPMMTIEIPVLYTFYLPMIIGILSYIAYLAISIRNHRTGKGGAA